LDKEKAEESVCSQTFKISAESFCKTYPIQIQSCSTSYKPVM